MKLVYKIILPIILIVVFSLTVVGVFMKRSIDSSILRERQVRLNFNVLKESAVFLTKKDFEEPIDQAILEKKLENFADRLKDASVARINIWNRKNEIIFSDDKNLIGRSFPEKSELVSVFQGERIAQFKKPNLKDPTLVPFSRFADIFIPLRLEAESDYAAGVEVISVADILTAPAEEIITNLILGVIFSGFLIMGVSFIIIKWFVVSPLNFLEEAADIIKEGNLEYKIGSDTRDEIGNLTRAFDNMRESLKEATRTLRKNLKQDEAILKSMEEGVIALSLDLRITVFNKMAEKLSGWKAIEVIGKSANQYVKFISEETKQEVNLFQEFLEKKEPCSISGLLLRGKNGTEIPVADFIAPILDESENILGFVLVLRDITKELEMDRAKNEFIGIASHEMRTPLSTIKSYAESFLSGALGKLTDEQLQFMSQINSSNEAAIDLINNLLLLSSLRLDEKFETKATDLDFIVAGNIARLNFLAKAKNISLDYKKTDQPLPQVFINPQLLSHAFKNILDNAIKYTSGGGHIEVKYEVKPESVAVLVKDSGVGIPESEHSRVFQKFYRSKQARLLYPTGIGLGLATTKTIIERMGGKIWFESAVGKGTAFYISLPIVRKT
ncbi:MAG: PAS domain-containing protein [Parcubacteria group bacterium]|nr:PAS domain-containing protein [Parcubacteria group bacterium]